jgi:Mn2+/Fe2+ NRAMP family transporter
VKSLGNIALGILTSIGGYLEVGSMGTALQAGAAYRYQLLWAIAAGTVCVAFLIEMSGRLAAVSHHTLVDAMRQHFGFTFQVWPLTAQLIVDLFVLASEIGGASLALELATGVSIRVWVFPVAFLVWVVLWLGTFGAIEHGVALLGLVTLCFVVAAFAVHPTWHEVARGLVPSRPTLDPAQYTYLAVAILGATISPYLVSFYSSGAVEERWATKDLGPNRIVAGVGMGFGSTVAAAIVIVSAIVLAPRGIVPGSYQQAATVLSVPLGRWGLALFCMSLFIGCVGAAFELSLDISYITAQTFGWNWGESEKPAAEARFSLVYTAAIAVAMLPSFIGIDPLKLTMFSMALTVVMLPLITAPLIVLMNDTRWLKTHTNGWISNAAVILIVLISFVLAALAIPVQIMGT